MNLFTKGNHLWYLFGDHPLRAESLYHGGEVGMRIGNNLLDFCGVGSSVLKGKPSRASAAMCTFMYLAPVFSSMASISSQSVSPSLPVPARNGK